jgi:hypothetical protein
MMAIFGGAFLIAVGEWRYYTGKEMSFRQTPAGVAKVTDVPHKIHIDGVMFQIVGVLAVLFGIYQAFSSGSL